MNGSQADFAELADIFTPRTLSQFLGVREWAMRTRLPFMETWINDDSGRPAYVHIPTDPTDLDFEKRFYEAAMEVAEIYGWSLAELAEHVAAIRADLFFVRVEQAGQDGTIPLHKAGELIDSIEKMVKAAAVVTANPRASGKGRTSERVRSFLEDDLRMGHTKRGSFIITVAARLQDNVLDLASRDHPNEALQGSFEDSRAEERPADSEQDSGPELDFTRRVMTTLAQSLDATRRHLARDDDFIDFDDARAEGMTSALVEAVEEIGESAVGGNFDLSFQWTPALPQAAVTVESVQFTRPLVERTPSLVERFRRVDEPAEVTIVGPVISLARADTRAAEESGEVIVHADVDGSIKRVGMSLSGFDYEWAIYAHRNKYPFTVSGVLGKKGRSWWLTDNVATDTSFLKQMRRDYIERLGGDAPEVITPPSD